MGVEYRRVTNIPMPVSLSDEIETRVGRARVDLIVLARIGLRESVRENRGLAYEDQDMNATPPDVRDCSGALTKYLASNSASVSLWSP